MKARKIYLIGKSASFGALLILAATTAVSVAESPSGLNQPSIVSSADRQSAEVMTAASIDY